MIEVNLKAQRYDEHPGRLDMTLTIMGEPNVAIAAGRTLENPSMDEVLTTFCELAEEIRDQLPAAAEVDGDVPAGIDDDE